MLRYSGIDSDIVPVIRRCTSKCSSKDRLRNYSASKAGTTSTTTTTTTTVLVVWMIISSCCHTSPDVASIFGNIWVDPVVAWMHQPYVTTIKKQRTISSNQRNTPSSLYRSDDERQHLLLRKATPIQTSNNNIEDKEPSSSISLNVPFLVPSSSCRVDQMSGTDLAYIGDVVYELYIRTRTVWPLKRTTDLQQQVVALVRGRKWLRAFMFDKVFEVVSLLL